MIAILLLIGLSPSPLAAPCDVDLPEPFVGRTIRQRLNKHAK